MLENLDKLSVEQLKLVQLFIDSLIRVKDEELTEFQKFQQLCY